MTKTRMHQVVTRLLCLYVLAFVVMAYTLAFGAPGVPPFPFQNTQQLGPGIPGLAPFEDPELGSCVDGRPLAVFSFGTYSAAEGAHGWRIYVEAIGDHLTGTYFAGGTTPKAIYFGTANRENGHITITRSELFDPAKHHEPCETWK